MSGRVASCAAVVVVLGQMPVGDMAGLIDRRHERIGAAGDRSAIHTTMIPIDSYHEARPES